VDEDAFQSEDVGQGMEATETGFPRGDEWSHCVDVNAEGARLRAEQKEGEEGRKEGGMHACTSNQPAGRTNSLQRRMIIVGGN